ncbi:carbonic anhydrase [Brooklawnia cerclae]|uniref:carbonic anhydrase n=1 Tax=Brooklawnia cerclae TaxID=349934 RepID=A0ABX0SEZ6_9ACTN|nr:carbonic anhydrase [Brooklawnia cerclae]NIH56952.1 carbonic anhydrase [Brooklawnia cerclae]
MTGFNDLLDANAHYAASFTGRPLTGKAQAGVLVLTCMDSRIDPLAILGLRVGDAKILRTPGAHVTPDALAGCVLGVHLLGVDRVLVVAHTRCAMASSDDATLRERVTRASGLDATGLGFGADVDRLGRLGADVRELTTHPFIGSFAQVGGFDYDVDTGRLTQVV